MKRIIINPLFVLAAQELSFLNQLPQDASDFTSKQKSQILSIYYKYFGTLPANSLQEIESGARQSRKNKGQADTQRIILQTVASLVTEPTALDLFILIAGTCPVLLARLVRHCYIVVNEDGSQVAHDTLFPAPPVPVSDSPLRTQVGDVISTRWAATGMPASGLTPGLLQQISDFIKNNNRSIESIEEVDAAIGTVLTANHVVANTDLDIEEVHNVSLGENDKFRNVHEAILKMGGRSTQASLSYVGEAIMGQTFSSEEEGLDAIRYAYEAFAASRPEYALNTEPKS